MEELINKTCGDNVTVAYPLFQTESSGAIPTSPLQFDITEISVDRACQLNKHWHSRLPIIPAITIRAGKPLCFGALYENYYYASAIWSIPVAANRFKNADEILELRRMAISSLAPKNTASRMLRVMLITIRKKYPEIKRLISYQDTEVHTGTIYKASGWQPIQKTEFKDWTTQSRQRNLMQSKADKIRWELSI